MSLENLIKNAQSNTKRSPVMQGNAATYPLNAIKPRQSDTRPLNPSHVDALMQSISALGLIEPLAIDNRGRLLAGGHRLAAIRQLKEQQPQLFEQHFPGDKIPVRMMDFDAELDPEQALNIEVAENEQRRDYTPSEVRVIAERLKAEGYKDGKGRPKAGEKALTPALQIIIGKSRRTVMSYLAGEDEKPKTVQRCTHLKRVLRELEEWEKSDGEEGEAAAKLRGQLPKIKKLLSDAISDDSE
jgi:ParB family transcriptional regulator, chromosome partitioning protein